MNPAKSIKWTVTFHDWDSMTLRQAFGDTLFYERVMNSMTRMFDDDRDRCQGSVTVKTSEELSRVLQIAYCAKYRGDVIVDAAIEFDVLTVNANLTSGKCGYMASSATMSIDDNNNERNRKAFAAVVAIESYLAELRNLAIRA